ncbi:DNA repair helicase [Methanocella paludicola SANAE]|uniref:DNA 3'-5' helicase n=1 Tax=Methanocella paludicola (strain DSM 17711 / JCM 13418 / NBRC 101707 / SANAE) TaxID=304371 RepID=D1YZG0_METPS|nr:DEAD/DEAH box helicase family protein [Methanocella paludicola]BAI61832.1 DNA repair helicase [Methanocella paludicola SANAE]
MIHLTYDRGTILVYGNVRVPGSAWDSRAGAYRAPAFLYKDIRSYVDSSGFSCKDDVLDLVPSPVLTMRTVLRDYQERAVQAWDRAGSWGIVVLPTGSGKTHVAMKAISLASPAIVIVPTLDLLAQWKERLDDEFGIDTGVYSGDEHRLGPVTVATYDTAYIRAAELGNKFRLVVFDEVHHLPSPGYMSIAEMFACPARLGLTATYEREDGRHKELPRLVGGKVFERNVESMEGIHLAPFDLRRIYVKLTADEEEQYLRDMDIYKNYLRDNNLILRTPRDFERLVMRSGRDKGAREAILARHRARVTALNSSSKLEALADVLQKHAGPEDKIIIFTEHNDLVYRISKQFLIPFITYTTGKDERSRNMAEFRAGNYRALVTSKVLDEGVDVPDANVGIILSGSGSKREFVQRLGRILRKKGDKKAVLYEIVSGSTNEVDTSYRRHKALHAEEVER